MFKRVSILNRKYFESLSVICRVESWQLPKGHNTNVKIFNSLTSNLDPLIVSEVQDKHCNLPIEKNTLKWYTCGPTVYDQPHLGHARTYVSIDIIQRILKSYFKQDVFHVMGVTDVDDKIINKAKQQKVDFKKICSQYENSFFQDLQELNVMRPHVITRVTQNIDQIIHLIQGIISVGHGYVIKDSGVYFDTTAFHCNPTDNQQIKHIHDTWSTGCDNEEDDSSFQTETKHHQEKKNKKDFVLWKNDLNSNQDDINSTPINSTPINSTPINSTPINSTPINSTPINSTPIWDSPWGKGRPGWHIECSANIFFRFGTYLDVHCGGIDLKFPHHANEISQSESFNQFLNKKFQEDRDSKHQHCHNNTQWSNYFIHIGHLHIEGRKMSKSLKNFITIKDCLKSYEPNHLRLFFLTHQYDSLIEYNENQINHSVNTFNKFLNFFQEIEEIKLNYTNQIKNFSKKDEDLLWDKETTHLYQFFSESKINIDNNLRNNFNTTNCIKILLNLIRKTNIFLNKKNQINNNNNNDFEIEKGFGVIFEIKDYILNLFEIFGFQNLNTNNNNKNNNNNENNTTQNLISVLGDFRSKIRTEALKNLKKNDNNFSNLILNLCDQLREDLVSQSILIQDLPQKNQKNQKNYSIKYTTSFVKTE